MTGNEFRQWRKEYGYTQNGIADELGVSRQTIVSWEKSAKHLPRLLELALKSVTQVRNVAGKRAHVREYMEQRSRPDEPGSKAKR